MCCYVVRWLSANLSLWTRCHENKAQARAERVYISTSLGHRLYSGPRFPGLGQAKARPKSVYTVKMLAKAGSVNTTLESRVSFLFLNVNPSS
jgi:hypothetical protein